MFVYFDSQGKSVSFSDVPKSGYENVPEFTDRNTQTVSKNILTGQITVTNTGTRGRTPPNDAPAPQFLALKTMVETNQGDLEGRVHMLEEINKTLTE